MESSSQIQVLPPDVVDRIAAGEVLDRPANLLKELVENCIDAGADQIDVEFQDGGRSVVVSDNGRGMTAQDLPLALQRHATSKIQSSDDLFQLGSYGFRGEALASIAAVSHLTITARTAAAALGTRVMSNFGQVEVQHEVSCAVGCEVRVRDLFANVPARLKFLKSDAAEHGQIKTTLKALALSHERVGFSVRSRDQLLFHWPKNMDFAQRAQAVLEVEPLYFGEHELDGWRAEVMVSSPLQVVNLNRNLWFFVQERWVQDKSLAAAVMEAYRNLLMHGEYPIAVVRLKVPPQDVDVNVHPAKSQIKFVDSQKAFRLTTRAVRQVLEGAPWLAHEVVKPAEAQLPLLEPTSVNPPKEDLSRPSTAPNLAFAGREFQRTQYATKSFSVQEVREAVRPYGPSDAQEFHWANLQVLGQLHQTYILAATHDAFFMVDQHAAHERVMFERLMRAFNQGQVEMQNLLLPLVLDFTPAEVDVLHERRTELEKLGLSVERMGPQSLAIQAIPLMVGEAAVCEALRRVAVEWTESTGELGWQRSVADTLATMACHSVVRAGQSLSSEEMRQLLVQMDEFPLSSFCPHGRPVYIKRRLQDIEREFGRLV